MSDKQPESTLAGEVEEKEGYVRDYLTGELIQAKPEEVEARQVFLKKLVEEYGYSKDQIQKEFYIKKGTRDIGPADIAVFQGKRHTIDNIHIIVETKRSDRDDGIEQLKSYLSPTPAEFGVWFNGNEIEYLQTRDEPPYFREIPDIPKSGETLEDVGLYHKEDLEPATELKSVFETIHNYIYANEGFLKEKVFNEMLKVIFIKMVDEKSGGRKCEFRVTDQELESVHEGRFNSFTSRIEDMFDRVKKEYRDVFDQNEKLNLSPDSLAFAVSQLQKYSLSRTPSEIKGTAFQTFIGPLQRGDRGEFFTPQPILELGVEILNPKDGEFILDPACGSGGFLIETMKYVQDSFHESRTDANDSELKDLIIRYAHNYIRGIDFNPDLAKVAKMYMVLYDDGHTGIFSENSLEEFDKIEQTAKEAGANSTVDRATFDIVLTNPPFGSKGEVDNNRILRQFELGYKWSKNSDTGRYEKTDDLQSGQSPEILFIERCLQFLDNGGRMGIVLPDGILTNSTTEYVRQYMVDNARVISVISLPEGTFRQAGVNPKTSVVFLQKLDKKTLDQQKEDDYAIFMAEADEIGYELDKKTAKTKYRRDENGELIRDENGEPIIETDIPDIVDEFSTFKHQNGLGF